MGRHTGSSALLEHHCLSGSRFTVRSNLSTDSMFNFLQFLFSPIISLLSPRLFSPPTSPVSSFFQLFPKSRVSRSLSHFYPRIVHCFISNETCSFEKQVPSCRVSYRYRSYNLLSECIISLAAYLLFMFVLNLAIDFCDENEKHVFCVYLSFLTNQLSNCQKIFA